LQQSLTALVPHKGARGYNIYNIYIYIYIYIIYAAGTSGAGRRISVVVSGGSVHKTCLHFLVQVFCSTACVSSNTYHIGGLIGTIFCLAYYILWYFLFYIRYIMYRL